MQTPRLPFATTANTARDMDQIRRAVGDKQMNYLGFSYGTELGSIYAKLFPSVVRVMAVPVRPASAIGLEAPSNSQFCGWLKMRAPLLRHCSLRPRIPATYRAGLGIHESSPTLNRVAPLMMPQVN